MGTAVRQWECGCAVVAMSWNGTVSKPFRNPFGTVRQTPPRKGDFGHSLSLSLFSISLMLDTREIFLTSNIFIVVVVF